MPNPVTPPVSSTPPSRETRVDRAHETREAASRIESWVEPDSLPTPNPRPGLVFRYIRKSILGEADPRNISKRTREGWVPVKAEEYPELCLGLLNESRDGSMVEIGGLILCAMSAERKASRDRWIAEKSRAQTTGVDNQLKNDAREDRRMPLFVQRESSVTFGRGS